MNYQETLEFIHSTDWKGSRLGLDRMREMMRRLGDPQDRLRFVHVAGTNGKGSTCAVLSSILSAAGYKTGMYTSPHLVKVNERMRINGADISDEDLILAAEAVKDAVTGMEDAPTEFEVITAMAFWYYAREKCDIVVLEVGLGGRLDATNVIGSPEAAVIVNLGLEHTETLGDTLAKIAAEKAGIIKSGSAVVAYRSEDEALDVIKTVCADRGVPLQVARFDSIVPRTRSLLGQTFDWEGYRDLVLGLPGEYQLFNAVTALETALVLRYRGWDISDEAIRKGLADARWEARFELLSREPLFLADGAHNPQCVEALAKSLDAFLPGEKVVFLTGVLADKDYPWMLAQLMPRARSFVCLTPDSPRALSNEALAEYLRQHGQEARTCGTAGEGILAALNEADGAPVVACGSLYMMGEIRAAFPKAKKKFLRKKVIAARKALTPGEHAAADEAIVRRIAESELYQNARTILIYAAMPGEVDLSPLREIARRDGKRLAFPRVVSKTEMIALEPREDAWTVGSFDIREPDPERAAVVPPEELDLVLCPCSGFDENANRLGMGGGYYDRYLLRCVNARVAAVAYEVQKLPALDTEPWDRPMERIFT